MPRKTLIWIGMVIGSILGGLVPAIWGADFLSFSSILFSTFGAIVGVWAGFKLGS